ncbi:hypothetical protein LQZ18_01525 [Lachnospiraceae bacterium ZAX-1]
MASKNITKNKVPEPWERQEEEGARAFQAFVAYRDMGASRNLKKVAEKCNKTIYIINRWSSEHKWGRRSLAWDDEQDRLARAALAKGRTAMLKNHADIATAMLVKALKGLKGLPEKDLNARDITSMVDIASKLERLSRGEATERVENKTEISGELKQNFKASINLLKLSDEEVMNLNEITERISED